MLSSLFGAILFAIVVNLSFYAFLKMMMAFTEDDSKWARYESKTKRREKVSRLAAFAKYDAEFNIR